MAPILQTAQLEMVNPGSRDVLQQPDHNRLLDGVDHLVTGTGEVTSPHIWRPLQPMC